MRKLIAAVTLLAGGTAVAGALLQAMQGHCGTVPHRAAIWEAVGTEHGAVFFAAGQIPPDTAAMRMRSIGSAVCTGGATYLSRHK